MKYGKFAKCSHDTALRDFVALVERGMVVRNPECQRSTNYSLAKITGLRRMRRAQSDVSVGQVTPRARRGAGVGT
jgi:hypothetical protein